MITNKKIGVLMGGNSPEREVSLNSGNAVYQALLKSGYKVTLIDVDKNIANVLQGEKIEFAFLALHGGYGENGSIQGLLEIMDIPYTGSGHLSSALAMDKVMSKKIFTYHRLPVAPYKILSKDMIHEKDFIDDLNIPLPWVVKPATEGSSIGISIIKEEREIQRALTNAFSYSSLIILEKYIFGTEVHIGMLGNKVLGGVEVKPKLEFYNYEAKYTAGLTDYIIPPQIEHEVYEKVKVYALKAHQSLGCSGITRVDLIIDEKATPYLLEVNTLPGMTTTSLIPKIAAYVNLTFDQLVEEMIRLGIEQPKT